jgi:uncharacterized protein
MKFVVVALVVVVVAWLLLRARGRSLPQRPGRAAAEPQAMVRCLHCGVHLPHADAVQDARGAFCSDAHRLAGPRQG